MNNFGNYIKKIRESKNMTLDEVANKSEISSAQLSRIENGKRGVPKPLTIKKLCEALEVDYNELMTVAEYITDTDESNGVLFNENQKLIQWYKELKYYSEEDMDLLYKIWENIKDRIK